MTVHIPADLFSDPAVRSVRPVRFLKKPDGRTPDGHSKPDKPDANRTRNRTPPHEPLKRGNERMNPNQLEACMAKLPPHLAREFERLHREADERLNEAWRLRRLAWSVYHDHERRL